MYYSWDIWDIWNIWNICDMEIYMKIYGKIWKNMEMYGKIWKYMEMFGNVQKYMKNFVNKGGRELPFQSRNAAKLHICLEGHKKDTNQELKGEIFF